MPNNNNNKNNKKFLLFLMKKIIKFSSSYESNVATKFSINIFCIFKSKFMNFCAL